MEKYLFKDCPQSAVQKAACDTVALFADAFRVGHAAFLFSFPEVRPAYPQAASRPLSSAGHPRAPATWRLKAACARRPQQPHAATPNLPCFFWVRRRRFPRGEKTRHRRTTPHFTQSVGASSFFRTPPPLRLARRVSLAASLPRAPPSTAPGPFSRVRAPHAEAVSRAKAGDR